MSFECCKNWLRKIRRERLMVGGGRGVILNKPFIKSLIPTIYKPGLEKL